MVPTAKIFNFMLPLIETKVIAKEDVTPQLEGQSHMH